MEIDDTSDERPLCPDGACVGLIGDDGRCGTCGRAGAAPAPRAPKAQVEAPTEPATEPAAERPQEPTVAADEAVDASPGEADPDARVPCDDGTCTGVLGADGRCGTCGRPAASP